MESDGLTDEVLEVEETSSLGLRLSHLALESALQQHPFEFSGDGEVTPTDALQQIVRRTPAAELRNFTCI